jgi:Flp pilus assembly protein TadD
MSLEQKIEELKEDFSLLIEAGFLAVKQLDAISSSRIFVAAQMISPGHTAPQIGLGYIALNQLNIKEATHIFELIIDKEPENYLAQTFLGMCYLLSKPKRKKGERIIKEAIEKTSDSTIKNLGMISLEWAEKDLKKAKAPFFSQQEEKSKK